MHGSRTRCAESRPNGALKHHQRQHQNHQKQKQRSATSFTRRRTQNHCTKTPLTPASTSSSKQTTDTRSSSSSSSESEDNESSEDEEEARVLTAMHHHARLDWKLGLLYTLLVLQLLLVMVYVTSTPHSGPDGIGSANGVHDTVSFVEHDLPPQAAEYVNKSPTKSTSSFRRHQQQSSLGSTIKGDTWLREHKTSQLYDSYNGTICWKSGTSPNRMKRDMRDADGPVDRCACEPGWHGSDCGQPEVVWRAIMASKQPTQLNRRKLARRVIHAFFVHQHNTAIAEVIVEELYHVVDLFVVCDFSLAEDNFRHKLAKGLLAKQQDKILYLNLAGKAKRPTRVLSKHIWEHVKRTVRNIREDDLYVSTDAEQIINSRALQFLSVYDGWPQPIGFRLRWSVFGFFWQHPSRTSIALGACSVGLLHEAFHNFGLEQQQLETNNVEVLGLVIGDLNHYGGWYCQFCQGPANVVVALKEMNATAKQMLQLERPSPDVAFVEELIGAGTWFDEKTSLLRAHRSSESYYAPETVMNQTWKYDWLLENFYAKLDYY